MTPAPHKFKCTFCDKTFSTLFAVTAHEARVHRKRLDALPRNTSDGSANDDA